MKITSQVKIIFSFWDHLNHENSHFGHFRPKMNNGTLQFWLFLNHCLHRSVRTTLKSLIIRSRRGNRSVLDEIFFRLIFKTFMVKFKSLPAQHSWSSSGEDEIYRKSQHSTPREKSNSISHVSTPLLDAIPEDLRSETPWLNTVLKSTVKKTGLKLNL